MSLNLYRFRDYQGILALVPLPLQLDWYAAMVVDTPIGFRV